ncbi:MAG: 23S rRNA (pseudouridine(1915)-N(3))-methyltransferase RlmH, partial [Bacteroidales bacterium]|nr:23S rRNA (pseudouridine(1915)-N(3))-methyltransferase RlmH [Bacteroidales bacterium]
MKITLLTVGKTDKDWVKQGMDIYMSRLKHYIPFSVVEIPELKNVSSLTKDQIKAREGELILKSIRHQIKAREGELILKSIRPTDDL